MMKQIEILFVMRQLAEKAREIAQGVYSTFIYGEAYDWVDLEGL